MGLDWLQYLLFDCTGAKAKRGYYIVGCFVSVLALVSSLTSLFGFFVDYIDRQPIYYSLPFRSYWIGYALCLIVALLASCPPLILGVLAVRDLPRYESHQSSLTGRICALTKFDNFYCHGSATRYLLMATLCSATIILSNILSICVLHAGIGRSFQPDLALSSFKQPRNSSTQTASKAIDSIQRSLSCCGSVGHNDWRQLMGHGVVPKSCSVDDTSTASGKTLISSDGCTSLFTGEQAALRGISNMLAFAGVLLLVAAWTRVERVAELTAKDVSNLFKEPRAPAEAAAFVERIGRQRSARLSQPLSNFSGSSPVDFKYSEAATSERSASLRSHQIFAAKQSRQPRLSTGFLYPSDDDVDTRQIVGRARKKKHSNSENNSDLADLGSGAFRSTATTNGACSSSSSGTDQSRMAISISVDCKAADDLGSTESSTNSNSPSQDAPSTTWWYGPNPGPSNNMASLKHNNNSALDITQPWLGAQPINSLLSGHWQTDYDDDSDYEDESLTRDSVQITDEMAQPPPPQPLQMLDVRSLDASAGTTASSFCSQRKSWSRRRVCSARGDELCGAAVPTPTFLFDYSEECWLADGHRRQIKPPFSTQASANF